MSKSYLKNNMGKEVSKNVNPNRLKKLKRYIIKYIDRNSEVLEMEGPFEHLILSYKDKNMIFDTIQMDKREVFEYIDDCEATRDFNVCRVPFNIATAMLLRECIIEEYDEDLELLLTMYLAFRAYSSKYRTYFKHNPNKNKLMLIINKEFDDSNDIKKLGSIYAAIKKKMESALENYRDRLIRGTDKDIIDTVNGIHDRMNGWLRGMANKFYEFDDKHSDAYLNLDFDSLDEDNYHIADNDMFKIDNISTKVIDAIMRNNVDKKLVKQTCDFNNLDKTSFANSLEDVLEMDPQLIAEIIKLTLVVYYDENREIPKVFNMGFMTDAIGFYKKPNTSDENIIRIKEILDLWLNETNDLYRKTNRKATINKLRKGLYVYFILAIVKYSK